MYKKPDDSIMAAPLNSGFRFCVTRVFSKDLPVKGVTTRKPVFNMVSVRCTGGLRFEEFSSSKNPGFLENFLPPAVSKAGYEHYEYGITHHTGILSYDFHF
jgi:hypothetical protein